MTLFALSDAAIYGLIAVGILIAIPIYLIPTIVANSRRHPNVTGVFLINLLLGWLLIGWAAALIWAVVAEPGDRYGRRRRREYRDDDDEPNPFDLPRPAASAPASAPATVSYTCPHCRGGVRVQAALMGTVVECGRCRGKFTATPVATPDD
jgi:hypothetical protein